MYEILFENNSKGLHSGDCELLDEIADILSNGNYDLLIVKNNRNTEENISEIDIDVDNQRIYFRTNHNISMVDTENYILKDFKNNLIIKKGTINKTKKSNCRLSIMIRFNDFISKYSNQLNQK